MGKLMLYGAGRACQIITCKDNDSGVVYMTVPTFKDTSGTDRNTISKTTSSSYVSNFKENASLFMNLTGYISTDTIDDFTLDTSKTKAYQTNAIADISYTRSSAVSTNGRTYTITATNDGASAVSVSSIKFTKTVWYNNNTSSTCLTVGYFLDTPVTIEAGATKTFAVNIDCWNY